MFTGIVECMGAVVSREIDGTNIKLRVAADITTQIGVDDSVSHNGICLTVTDIQNDTYTVCAIAETIAKTNLGNWQVSDKINLERAAQFGSRLDGHLVQGHVDCTTDCMSVDTQDGSWLYTFALPTEHAALMIEKGSITINGTSLTCFDVQKDRFSVAIIPYTYEHTTIQYLKRGDIVNLEFDLIGKYLQRYLQVHTKQ
jgi:riboflavin synthase